MGKPYSVDLRERVVAVIEGGESTHQAAARFAIGIVTAGAWAPGRFRSRLATPAETSSGSWRWSARLYGRAG